MEKLFIIPDTVLNETIELLTKLKVNTTTLSSLREIPHNSLETAKEILSSQGYAVESLYCIADLHYAVECYNEDTGNDYSLTDEKAKEMIEEHFGNTDASSQHSALYEIVQNHFEQ